MRALQDEVLELCKAYDGHITAGSTLDERDVRAAEMLRLFQKTGFPGLLVQGQVVMGRHVALWECGSAGVCRWVCRYGQGVAIPR